MRKDIDNTETVVNTVLCMLYIDLINDPALLGGDNDKWHLLTHLPHHPSVIRGQCSLITESIDPHHPIILK